MSWSQNQVKLLGQYFSFYQPPLPLELSKKLDAAPHLLLSLRNIWRAHLLQKTRAAECLQHTETRRPPGSQISVEKQARKSSPQRGPYARVTRDRSSRCFSCSFGTSLSFFLSSLPNYWHCWSDRNLQLHVVLQFVVWTINSLTFFSKLSWSPRSDHPFLQLCPAKGADTVRTVWKVLVLPEPAGTLTVFRRTGYTSSASPELWAQTPHICSCMIIDEL